jgi:hypothetical protein
MADTTTLYSFPYLESTDPPDIAGGLQDLAEAVETSSLGAPPHVVLTLAESVPNNSITTLTPTAELRDIGSMWTSGSNITIPSGQGGWYEIGVVYRYASQATAANTRQARINVNSVEQMTFQVPTSSVLNATNVIVSGVYETSLSAGDVITFSAFQNSGGALALVGNSRVWVRKLR